MTPIEFMYIQAETEDKMCLKHAGLQLCMGKLAIVNKRNGGTPVQFLTTIQPIESDFVRVRARLTFWEDLFVSAAQKANDP